MDAATLSAFQIAAPYFLYRRLLAGSSLHPPCAAGTPAALLPRSPARGPPPRECASAPLPSPTASQTPASPRTPLFSPVPPNSITNLPRSCPRRDRPKPVREFQPPDSQCYNPLVGPQHAAPQLPRRPFALLTPRSFKLTQTVSD